MNKRSQIFTHWLPLLLWMSIIFLLSHHDKDETSLKSGLLKEILAWLHIDGAALLKGPYKLIIRKFAHIFVYAVLFLLSSRVVSLYRNTPYNWRLSFLFCFFYACTDEFHQTFINGRYGTPVDVAIDILGAGIAFLLIRGWRKWKKPKH